MRVDAPPRVTFLLRQVSQVSIAERLRLSIAHGTFPILTLQRCLASSLGNGFGSSTQFTGCAQRHICMPSRARAHERIRLQTALSVDPRTAKCSISRHH
jgi:hypothetical protein